MFTNELISIIIPIYNSEKYLLRCVNSIAKQSYENIEIILIDDGSKDDSRCICDNLAKSDSRIIVIHKPNGGQSSARNEGVKVSKGKYISFVDSDDEVDIDFIKYLYYLIKINNSDLSICRIAHFNEGEKITFSSTESFRLLGSNTAIKEMFYQYSWLESPCNKLYEKSLFDDTLFNEDLIFEDSLIMPSIFEKCKNIVYGDASKYAYIHRKNSTTTAKYTKKQLDIIKVTEELYKRYRTSSLEKSALSYRMSANMRVFLNAPDNEEFFNVINDCKIFIQENWKNVFFDKNVRVKSKASLILFLFGRKNILRVYRMISKVTHTIKHD